MKFHKVKHEAALNFGCNKPSHPSEWRCVARTQTRPLENHHTGQLVRVQQNLWRKSWCQDSTADSHPHVLTPPGENVLWNLPQLKLESKQDGQNVGDILFGWRMNVAQWFVGSSASCLWLRPQVGTHPPCWRVPEQSAASQPAPGTVTLGLWSSSCGH